METVKQKEPPKSEPPALKVHPVPRPPSKAETLVTWGVAALLLGGLGFAAWEMAGSLRVDRPIAQFSEGAVENQNYLESAKASRKKGDLAGAARSARVALGLVPPKSDAEISTRRFLAEVYEAQHQWVPAAIQLRWLDENGAADAASGLKRVENRRRRELEDGWRRRLGQAQRVRGAQGIRLATGVMAEAGGETFGTPAAAAAHALLAQLYFQQKQMDLARRHAEQATRLGYPVPELAKLRKTGELVVTSYVEEHLQPQLDENGPAYPQRAAAPARPASQAAPQEAEAELPPPAPPQETAQQPEQRQRVVLPSLKMPDEGKAALPSYQTSSRASDSLPSYQSGRASTLPGYDTRAGVRETRP